MKKILLSAIAIFTFSVANAQEQTKKGKWVIEVNTGSHATGNTAISFHSSDNETLFNFGADGGYFVIDNLAIKGGFGVNTVSFKGGSSLSTFAYKLGAQYYIINKIPVGVDFTGLSSSGNSASWLGLEGGYAIFLGKNVAVTPKLRYNSTLDKNTGNNFFQGLVGFSLFF